MGTRSVRLDDESEQALAEVREATGLSVSRDAVAADVATDPWTVYEALDLGPGGYARAPARDAKAGIRRLQ